MHKRTIGDYSSTFQANELRMCGFLLFSREIQIKKHKAKRKNRMRLHKTFLNVCKRVFITFPQLEIDTERIKKNRIRKTNNQICRNAINIAYYKRNEKHKIDKTQTYKCVSTTMK